ncbi:DNA polymerase III subunit beta [Methylomonas methanica]|uniref:DNA polymerase III subunit beta n=1 Tax=Methylomonas methanica TaxID=421 RepID=A0A177MHG8_METMH|nr:nucleotidyltransferase domain-containing protein [Methylomonas methanica]OAI04380.1 DNA polymerase III subunit beta [Methylomonas methanica]
MPPHPIDPNTLAAARLFIGRTAGHFRLAGALLFGSRARGDHRAQSDTDVAVLLSGAPGPFLETKLALADIAYDVLLETGVLIQPLPIWQSEWDCPESSTHPRLLENVKRDGVPL